MQKSNWPKGGIQSPAMLPEALAAALVAIDRFEQLIGDMQDYAKLDPSRRVEPPLNTKELKRLDKAVALMKVGAKAAKRTITQAGWGRYIVCPRLMTEEERALEPGPRLALAPEIAALNRELG